MKKYNYGKLETGLAALTLAALLGIGAYFHNIKQQQDPPPIQPTQLEKTVEIHHGIAQTTSQTYLSIDKQQSSHYKSE